MREGKERYDTLCGLNIDALLCHRNVGSPDVVVVTQHHTLRVACGSGSVHEGAAVPRFLLKHPGVDNGVLHGLAKREESSPR